MYIGYSTNFESRKSKHFSFLRNNNHSNEYLQRAFNEYGEENFVFEILEEYPDIDNILPSMEHYWCNLLNVHNPKLGYNIRPTHPEDRSGMCKETALKAFNTRKNNGKEWHSEETKSKIGLGNTGKIRTEEQKEKLKGRTLSEEIKTKMSKSHLGKKASKESVEKRLKAMENYKHSDETKRKMSEASKGKKKDPLVVEKRAKAMLKPIYKIDESNNIIEVYSSAKEAGEVEGLTYDNVLYYCNVGKKLKDGNFLIKKKNYKNE